MGFVYILFSEKLNKFYIGVSVDIDRRLNEHNSGKSKFTSRGVPWQLMYTEVFPTLIEAKKRELQIKKRKSRIYLQELIDGNSSNAIAKTVLGSPAQERDSLLFIFKMDSWVRRSEAKSIPILSTLVLFATWIAGVDGAKRSQSQF